MQLTPEKSVAGANPKFDTTTEYHYMDVSENRGTPNDPF